MFIRYRSVLSVPGTPRLFVSALVARVPQGMSTLAILLLVRGATGSYPAAGAAVGAYALASAVVAPFQGALVDRFGRGRVLAPSAFAQGIVLITLVVFTRTGAGAAVLVALSGLAGGLYPPIAPTVRALLRERLADPTVRESAYALESVAQEIIWITGPLLVALVITVISPPAAVLLLGAVCMAGTVLFVRSPLAAGPAAEPRAHRRVAALRSAQLRALLPPIALTGVGIGGIDVGLPALALHAGSRSASGVMLALWSAGSLAGGLWYGSRSWSSPLSARYRLLLLILVVCTAPLIAARSVPAGLALSLVAGLGIAPMFSCQYALIGRAAAPGSETEAFTWVTAALVGGLAAGSAAGGALAARGVSAPFILSCAATALAAVLATVLGERRPAYATPA